jgi:SpoVK/Ycf46/Vps4 family AAA+-type ATPase
MYDWGMHKKLKPGYRVLFHGPPGTGKTLTATLLGKYTGKDVFKIDLSMVVSKFIGETEKNLANLLSRAEKTENILFFDEADALFGKRTNVRDAHDKYANQEVSYLLQRIEYYKGLVILASNLKSNIDESFVRRFQAIVHFPLPKASERLMIWEKAFPPNVRLEKDIELGQIAQKYELSGAEIMNVVQYACLCALEDKKKTIYPEYLAIGIQREFQKGGRIMR